MHSNDTRVTLIFSNVDWFTFTLKDECAYLTLNHSNLGKDIESTEFVYLKEKLYLCTNFIYTDLKNENIINESYNKVSCDLIDLDKDEA